MELKGYQQHVLGDLKDYIAANAVRTRWTSTPS